MHAAKKGSFCTVKLFVSVPARIRRKCSCRTHRQNVLHAFRNCGSGYHHFFDMKNQAVSGRFVPRRCVDVPQRSAAPTESAYKSSRPSLVPLSILSQSSLNPLSILSQSSLNPLSILYILTNVLQDFRITSALSNNVRKRHREKTAFA